MPKKTFMNLPESKQKTIFDAAIEEFSQYRFSDASINRIIKVARIPRGSFYQYFSGKEDIYTYMYSEIVRKLNEAGLNTLPSAQDTDAFDFFIRRMEVTLRMNKEKPQYTRICHHQQKNS